MVFGKASGNLAGVVFGSIVDDDKFLPKSYAFHRNREDSFDQSADEGTFVVRGNDDRKNGHNRCATSSSYGTAPVRGSRASHRWPGSSFRRNEGAAYIRRAFPACIPGAWPTWRQSPSPGPGRWIRAQGIATGGRHILLCCLEGPTPTGCTGEAP